MLAHKKTFALAAIILIAAMTRLIPHPMNFAPLGAMALFGAAYFGRKGGGLLLTMTAWLVSDLVLNNLVYPSAGGFRLFTEGAVYIYGSIALIYFLGTAILAKVTIPRMIAGSLSASVVFFLLSNFGVWAMGIYYPFNLEGLVACYAAALPFFKNTMAGDLAYSVLLIWIYERYLRERLTMSRVRDH